MRASVAVQLRRLLAHQAFSAPLWCTPPSACVSGSSSLGSGCAAAAVRSSGAARVTTQRAGRSQHTAAAGRSGDAHVPLALRLAAMDAIHLRGLLFHGYHGVLPEERTLGQKFLVDATLYCGDGGLAAAGASDDLAQSVNYAVVYERMRQVMEGPPLQLLEAAAARLCEGVLAQEPRVSAVRVHVRKPHVALRGPLESVGIEILRARDGSGGAP